MPRAGQTASQWDRGKVEVLTFKFAAADGGSHDIDDGIRRADFVKVNIVGGNPVYFSFGFSQAAENSHAGVHDFGMKPTARNHAANLPPGTIRFLGRTDNVKLGRADSMARFVRFLKLEAKRWDFFQFGIELP